MMDVSIGPTTVTVCESTAHCCVINPTETYVDQIADYIFTNNYVCDAIFHDKLDKAQVLQNKVGGRVCTTESELKSILTGYS